MYFPGKDLHLSKGPRKLRNRATRHDHVNSAVSLQCKPSSHQVRYKPALSVLSVAEGNVANVSTRQPSASESRLSCSVGAK
jgi:hypothetical protein